MSDRRRYFIGIDTGGTFTDITVIDDRGEVFVNKAPTTPWDFSVGVIGAVHNMSEETLGISSEELLRNTEMFKVGSTVATNALITRTGSKVGLITTKGFEDTTIIMRAIGRVAGLGEQDLKHQAVITKPEPIVPPELIRGVTERIDFRGEVIIPLDVAEAREAIRSLIEDEKVEALAVNLLWGFVNPTHENRIRELIEEMYPSHDLFLTFASETIPAVREYARSNTVIINSFLGKTIRKYFDGLGSKLGEKGYQGTLLVMQSNGGVVHRDEVTPIGNIGSGPSGGIIASRHLAGLLGHRHVITTDMGGTSFDVGVIVDGFWRYMREPVVERFNITWPMIDIESIGAGGGTIAWIDPITGGLKLGPQSAAADPGPVCYGGRGTEPTITDADVVLGLIDPNNFLGGKMKLDVKRAEEAIREKIAKPLGMDVVEAAAGIHDVINNHMSDLIRKQVATTGHSPDDFVVYAFGGAGPVHAAGYGAELNARSIHVFSTSPVFSSFGVALADVMHTHTASYRFPMPIAPEKLNSKLREIEDRLLSVLNREGLGGDLVSFRRTLYMRYRRQLNELDVPVAYKEYNEDDILQIMRDFERRYEEVYGAGSAYSEAGIEVISFRVDAIGSTVKPHIKEYPPAGVSAREALKGHREAYFSVARAFLKASVFDFACLRHGNVIDGPAIAESAVTAVVIPPGWVGRVDRFHNLELVRQVS